jgi:hypothetical protein
MTFHVYTYYVHIFNFEVIIEGVRGPGPESDIAIDDVAVTAGMSCLLKEPTPR